MKNQIKYLQNIFYDLLNDYGRVYIVVKYSENTKIGSRGFTEEEKEKGLVLVFTDKNFKTLQWTDDGSIRTSLGFGAGNRPEKCYLHFDDIVSVYSPDAMVKIDRWDMIEAQKVAEEKSGASASQQEKIVSLDNFRKTKA